MTPQEALALIPAAFVKIIHDYPDTTNGKRYVSLERHSIYEDNKLVDVEIRIWDDRGELRNVSCYSCDPV